MGGINVDTAQRREAALPDMRDRRRIRIGAWADLTDLDRERVLDQATYDSPAKPSTGSPYVLINCRFVVRDSQLVADAVPGRPIRR